MVTMDLQANKSVREAGFTLIEVMVVCTLIAVVSGLAIPHWAINIDDIAQDQALEFASVIKLVREESALSGKLMKIGFTHTGDGGDIRGYDFYTYDGGWTKHADDLLHQTLFSEEIGVVSNVTNGDDDSIVIDPFGLGADFTILFLGEKNRYEVGVGDAFDIRVIKRALYDR